jgi:hypothetical protein
LTQLKDALAPLYRQMATEGKNFGGMSIMQHAKSIRKLVKRTNATTLLDYGSGAGGAYKETKFCRDIGIPWHQVTLYDPAFAEHSKKPKEGKKFDGVLCSDVLEHIPEDEVQAFIQELFNYAKRFVWASVCCRPAGKTFPNGITNLHVTLKNMDWWHERFREASATNLGAVYHLVETP